MSRRASSMTVGKPFQRLAVGLWLGISFPGQRVRARESWCPGAKAAKKTMVRLSGTVIGRDVSNTRFAPSPEGDNVRVPGL